MEPELPSAVTSDKDSFYLPFFTRTQLYILTNSVGLTQKIKDQALILKLGKSTSQEINPNCRPRVLGAFGNWESRQLLAYYTVGKRTKNNPPPFRVVRVRSKLLHCEKYKTRKPVGFMQSCCFVFNGNQTKTCVLCNSYLFGMNNVLYIE